MTAIQETEKARGTFLLDGQLVDYDPDMQVTVVPKLTPRKKRELHTKLTLIALAARAIRTQSWVGKTQADFQHAFEVEKKKYNRLRLRGLFVHRHKGRPQRQHLLRVWPKHKKKK